MSQTYQIYRSNNVVLSITKYPIGINSSFVSGAYTAIKENDALNRFNTSSGENTLQSLLTIRIGALVPGLLETEEAGTTYYIPTDSISVSDDESWDYFNIYDQNSFNVSRFIYDKPTFRTITISGKCLINTIIDSSSYLINGSKYMYDIKSSNNIFQDIRNFSNYSDGPKKYFFQVQDGDLKLDLGGYFLPQSWSLDIPAGDFGDATWSATFIGPATSGVPLSPASVVGDVSLQTPTSSAAYRNMNTRDFYISLTDGENSMSHPVIGCKVSAQIDWEKLNTNYGYRYALNNIDFLPSYTFWSMKNMSGSIKLVQLFKTIDSGRIMIPGPASTPVGRQNIGINQYRIMNLYINNEQPASGYRIFDKIYWKNPSVDLKTDSAMVITREGAYHDSTFVG